jgi:selenocysteine-specific elongation factor
MKGFGTVVTGTLVAGSLRLEDEVELYPLGKRLRVRGLHSGGEAVQCSQAGQRTAVNLAGIDHHLISRGMCLAPPDVFEPTNRIDAQITLLPSAKKMKNRVRVHFHQGTAETLAEVALIGVDEMQPGSAAFAQLHLKDKLLLLPGDRFIVRQFSPVVTIGGGVVIDAKPARHRRNDASVMSALKIFANGSRPEILLALAQGSKTGTVSAREKKGTVSAQELTARMGWTEDELRAAAQPLMAEEKLRIVSAPQQPLVFASSTAVTACSEVIRDAVNRFHRENPLLPGIPRQDLRSRCGQRDETLFDASLNDLVKGRELNVVGDLVQRAGRTTTLAPEEERSRELIEREFESAGLTVPNLASVLEKVPVEGKRARNILEILLREKVLVRVTVELVFHCSAVVHLRKLLADYRKEKGPRLPVPAFKELTGVSRKYAIPLLEYLDREQVTRRVGDERVIL